MPCQQNYFWYNYCDKKLADQALSQVRTPKLQVPSPYRHTLCRLYLLSWLQKGKGQAVDEPAAKQQRQQSKTDNGSTHYIIMPFYNTFNRLLSFVMPNEIKFVYQTGKAVLLGG